MKKLCTNCGKNEAREGKEWCQECKEKHVIWRIQRNENYIKNGICVECRKNKVEKGKQRCKECLDYTRINYKIKKEECKKENICMKCGELKEEGNDFRFCLKCRKKSRKSQRELILKRKQNHKCINCGGKLDNDTTKCWKCRIKHREYMKLYNERGRK